MDDVVTDEERRLLRDLTGQLSAQFRQDQLEVIRILVRERRRVLLVQRTGWGKSAVYFISTKLLRDAGAGPTILISPLLALMRNQIQACERIGLRARTMNSTNIASWGDIEKEIDTDRVDLLLISPERLSNDKFQSDVLPSIAPRSGLVVIDEAHCISDWGHDFRPDYRRIRGILSALSPGIPLLACTATANDRVVEDITEQLGRDLVVARGKLARSGLKLSVIAMPSQAERLAWLANVIPDLPGSGIVYTLSKRDAELASAWLRHNRIAAASYTSDSAGREELEQSLLNNELKVLVATSALGMGFDKPDLAFVIHFQAPGSPVAYYQQVGRAGRAIPEALGVLLLGEEDENLQNWFISHAFPTNAECSAILGAIEGSEAGCTIAELERTANIRYTRIELLLKNLLADGAIIREKGRYVRTARQWSFDYERVEGVTEARREEQAQMRAYASDNSGCRMAYLQTRLDDLSTVACGICDQCSDPSLSKDVSAELKLAATEFIRGESLTIEPRKRWPTGIAINHNERVEEGKALSRWGDSGWGNVVAKGKANGNFDDALVDAAYRLVRQSWKPQPPPTWVTFVPSLRNASLVREFAEKLANQLELPAHSAIRKARETMEQKQMENSTHQFSNISGVFEIAGGIPEGAVLLVDDVVDSRWTMTCLGALLRSAGCPAVHPLALALATAS